MNCLFLDLVKREPWTSLCTEELFLLKMVNYISDLSKRRINESGRCPFMPEKPVLLVNHEEGGLARGKRSHLFISKCNLT